MRLERALPTATRLAPRHWRALRDIAFGVEESDAGLCTRYLFDEFEGPDEHEATRLFDGDRCLDIYQVFSNSTVSTWRAEIKRARRALTHLQETGQKHAAAILRVAYGPEDPSTREWPAEARAMFGPELVSLVRYTDTTEQIRRLLVRCEMAQKIKPKVAELKATTRRVIDLGWLRAYERQVDKIVTSGDAVHAALGLSEEDPLPSTLWSRSAFVIAAKHDAEVMLTEASVAYHRAWLRTPAP